MLARLLLSAFGTYIAPRDLVRQVGDQKSICTHTSAFIANKTRQCHTKDIGGAPRFGEPWMPLPSMNGGIAIYIFLFLLAIIHAEMKSIDQGQSLHRFFRTNV